MNIAQFTTKASIIKLHTKWSVACNYYECNIKSLSISRIFLTKLCIFPLLTHYVIDAINFDKNPKYFYFIEKVI